jgi:hypothetical protein
MMKRLWILTSLTLVLAGCINNQKNPKSITSIPKAETVLKTPGPMPSPSIFSDVRTPGAGKVQVVLSGGYFSIADANGNVMSAEFYQPGAIYLPPGEYRWWAYTPIPTHPSGCFVHLEYYGYEKEGSFLASRDRITTQVKLGEVLAPCTPTPEGK